MSASERLALAADASVARLDGEAVVLHLRTGRFFTVNACGSTILAALESASGATRAELVERVCTTFAVDAARATPDVDAFLDQLERGGLLAAPRPGSAS